MVSLSLALIWNLSFSCSACPQTINWREKTNGTLNTKIFPERFRCSLPRLTLWQPIREQASSQSSNTMLGVYSRLLRKRVKHLDGCLHTTNDCENALDSTTGCWSAKWNSLSKTDVITLWSKRWQPMYSTCSIVLISLTCWRYLLKLHP